MEGDVHGVRILPPLIEFKDCAVNKSYKVNITVKNVSKKSSEIRYYGPQSKCFKFKVNNPEKPVPAGLEVPATIEYTCTDENVNKDRLVVTVEGNVIEVPVIGYPCLPDLVIQGPVDFGHVVASSRVISRTITIYNHGSKEGDFKLKYSGDKPIAVVPSSGKVLPNDSQVIKVEYVTKVPGSFDEVIKVKLEGKESVQLHVKGHVVNGSLELLSCESEQILPCIDFGSTYYGSDQTQVAMLCNNGPEPTCFVAVLQEDAIGQEVTSTGQAGGKMNPLTSLVTAIPNQGMLGPYEKIPVFFRFSPRWTDAKQGFNCSKQPPPIQQFALFMHFKAVGASEGFQDTDRREPKSNAEAKGKSSGSILEVALKGTAQPVLISVAPLSKFDFGECLVGDHVDALCSLHNDSKEMSASFKFRRLAHFTTMPVSGNIGPGDKQEIIFSFRPNQAGTFKPTQYVDILGQVADENNPFSLNSEVIQCIPIQFLGTSDPITIKKEPVFNPGITPLISNEVGLYADVPFSGSGKNPRAALHNSLTTQKSRSASKRNEQNVRIAFPNDRAQSIRPSERGQKYESVFKRIERHNYVDPDYAMTDEEMEKVKEHKNGFRRFLGGLMEERHHKELSKEYKKHKNTKDIGIKPAAGLRPKKLKLEDVKPDPSAPPHPNAAFKLLSSKELAQTELKSLKHVKDGLNAIPTTAKEKTDCQKILSPKELHQVIIGPPTVDFGKVCLKSVTYKEINIINNLNQHIHVNVAVDCRELRQTSPLSQVVPPNSKAALPLIFESSTKGRFQRSLDYTINGFYKNHLTTFAEVVSVSLEMSTCDLIVEPQVGLPADAGIRGVITLYNRLNYPAEFTWNPILGDRGTAFSVRPATGIVDAHTDLDCEVVFHPSYMAPEEGFFTLKVHGGNSLKLRCSAKLGATNVQFIDRRIVFGQVPLHLTTTRKAMLKNTGLNHAYFQVLDPNPFPGLTVSPIHGIVPVGGNAQLQIHLTPNAVIKFDTRINISIRGWKTLELRVGGTVEPPVVEIDIPSFQVGGVYCGSTATLPFKLINNVHTKAKVEFDLSRYQDFTMEFPNKQNSEDITFQLMNPGVYSVTLNAHETINSQLIFKPTEVASYDFIMPVTINQTGAPTPAPTPFPPTPAPSHKNSIQHIVNPRPIQVTIATPRRKVVATALRQPLHLSHHLLEFSMTPKMHSIAASAVLSQNELNSRGLLLVNNSDHDLKWAIDLSRGNQALEDGIFKFLHSSGMPIVMDPDSGVEGNLTPGQTQALGVMFCPEKPGIYEVCLPVVLDDDFERPYQMVTLRGELKAPQLWFDPLALVLTPVPLQIEISSEFQIMAANYAKKCKITAELPSVECGDGSTLSPLSISFPEGQEVVPCSGDDGQDECTSITCKLSFQSPKPVSFTKPITFKDELGNSFSMSVSASADNCLMTCYPFLAHHRADHQIVCAQGQILRGPKTASMESIGAGEAVLLPCVSPHGPGSRPSTTATSSNFEISSSSYEDNINSMTESTYPSTPREGAFNKFTAESEQPSQTICNDLQSRSLGSALFPDEDTDEGVFHTEVLLAVQRWFASQGWSGGPNPITVPESMRSGISRIQVEDTVTNAKGQSYESSGLKKETKTVYDMINHLCGKPVPGIPVNNPLPTDPMERAKQVYWQHSTLIAFLKAQGGCVASLKPEYLMEPQEYRAWMRLQKELEARKNKSGHRSGLRMKTVEEETIEDQLFEAVSKRAWTDILLQLLKTLYLSRVTPRQFKNMPTPYKSSAMPLVDADPLCSNVYSLSERILLLWLNHNYEQQRTNIWQTCNKGELPPARWVVNFDFDLLDGLVLAAVLSAYIPFLVDSHFREMYPRPATAEQCLHNALRVVNAMRVVGIDYDISAIDITDPNPIALLLLCIHLYLNLPQYLPRNTLDFVGGLHVMVLRQVKLTNPSNKPLTYHALIAGRDAADFHLPKGDTVILAPKSTMNLMVEFTSRFLRPAEAILVLVGRRQGSGIGSTLVFNLRSLVDSISPKTTIKVESPCYELHTIPVEVVNPFGQAGEFHLLLAEKDNLLPGKSTKDSSDGKSLSNSNWKKQSRAIRSKVDSGLRREMTPDMVEMDPEEPAATSLDESNDENLMPAFTACSKSVHLGALESGTVDINFLPFHTGSRKCSLIFLNEDIGEFIYEIEANATLPLPSSLPFKLSPHSVRISSAAAFGRQKSNDFGGVDDNVVFWKCECGSLLQESLCIPVRNAAKEKALLMSATQHMSQLELDRRHITGTLQSTSLVSKAMSILGGTQTADLTMEDCVFDVELDSKLFQAPKTISFANNAKESDCIELPIKFQAKDAGHYTCRVTLSTADDIRVYFIDCTVIPEGNEAELEFTSPVHQAITQDIPIVNNTNHDWPIEAQLEGAGFVGPQTLMAKAQTTSLYPLVFRPSFEGPVKGELRLTNTADGVVHTFHLEAKGEKPLPLEQIAIECTVKEMKKTTVQVPNITKKKLHYKVESDLGFVTGPEMITVLPGQLGTFELSVAPLKRGYYTGVISFVAGNSPIKEVDSDGDEVEATHEDDILNGYRVWYSLVVDVLPQPPVTCLTITCNCQKTVLVEVGVTNPTRVDLCLQAEVRGQGLTGPSELLLTPKARGVYELEYTPAIVDTTKGSLVFYHDATGEFWYDITLIAEKPLATTMPPVECELGRWVQQELMLFNPTDETLELMPMISNTNNFLLERDSDSTIQLRPHSTIHLPISFMPSALGPADHSACISFHCPQLGEWVYNVSGVGVLPQPQDPVSITAIAGSNSTIIIPFRNPLDVPVLAKVSLLDLKEEAPKALDAQVLPNAGSPFCLLLKQKEGGLRLGPKASLDIPISFGPEDMQRFEAECVVSICREDGQQWTAYRAETSPKDTAPSWQVNEIKWIYPIHGYPELSQGQDSPSALIQCKARERVEERLEVTLSGVAPAAGGPKRGIKARSVTPTDESPRVPEGVVVGETMAKAEEFSYEMVYDNDDSERLLKSAVALKLIRQHRDKHTGLVVLVFNVVFAPFKTISNDAQLRVQGATGGMWRFPLKFVATEPEPDDLVIIEASALNQESAIGFRLTSQTRHPIPYNAYFVAGSDSEFTVTPQTGELLPTGSNGTLISVVFKPTKYGKLYSAKLVVQSPDMQWTYTIRGVLPEYQPPAGYSSHPMAGPHPDPRRHGDKVNYVRENLRLSTTAVSSPIKGAPIVQRGRARLF